MLNPWLIASFFLSIAVGITCGGNGTFSMAAAFGSDAITKRRALFLAALFLFLGAVTASRNVVQRLNSDITFRPMDLKISTAILLSTFLCILFATLVKVSLSTSEMSVGAIIGVGLFFNALFSETLTFLFISWILSAILCLVISYVAAKFFLRFSFKPSNLVLILIGCFFSFAIGANNVGNAIAPILNFTSFYFAILCGGLSLAVGAFLFRGGVMKTVGKNITALDTKSATIASFVAFFFLIVLSLLGIPAPGAQIFTLSIIGVRLAKRDRQKGKKTIIQILTTWIGSPLIAIAISFFVLFLIY